MLDTIYMQVLDMSKTASIVILVVLLARLLLKKAPKVFSYALWAVVLFRLLCPFGFEASVSVVPEMPSVSEGYMLSEEPISVLGASEAAYQAVGDALNGGLGIQHVRTTEKDETGMTRYVATDWWSVWILFGQYVWVAGIAVMLLYSVVSYLKIRKQLLVIVPLRDNIFIADDIQSPFVVGLFRPRIYLPCNLSEREQEYIILHEQHHIKRFDHVFKALAFLALAIHWFNPLVWAAFILASRDMEMSCDEAVIRRLGSDVRADYSASLLTLATGQRIIAGTPLAFGEGDTKGRINNLARWKKPAFWIMLVAGIVCAAVVVCFLTNPVQGDHLRLVVQDSTRGTTQAQYEIALGDQVLSGSIYVEQWDNGTCVRSAPVVIHQNTEEIRIVTSPRFENSSPVGTDIQIETGETGGSLRTYFPFPEDDSIIGWAFGAYELKEKVKIAFGDEVILAAMVFDEGNGIRTFDPESLISDPERLRGADYMVVIRACFGAEQPDSQNTEPIITGSADPEESPAPPDVPATTIAVADLDLDQIKEDIMVRQMEAGRLYELSVVKNGTVLWSKELSTAHAGWGTIMLYNEDGQDYLVEYYPYMNTGLGGYSCTVFSLAGGEETVKQAWSVEFKAPAPETAELTTFAEEVGILLRNCAVLLSTEQGVLVDQWTDATELPQIYPVRFDPSEIIAAMEGITQPRELTANAAQFPDAPVTLLFASGAGAWGTILTLQPDGSFTGSYRDSDMGDYDAEYPSGTCYVCEFSGQFTDIQQISDYAWLMKVSDFVTEKEPGEVWIADQIQYVASEAYGLSGGNEFLLYAPGTPVDEMYAPARDWWPNAWHWRNGEIEHLDGWGLCNVSLGAGFFTTWLTETP